MKIDGYRRKTTFKKKNLVWFDRSFALASLLFISDQSSY